LFHVHHVEEDAEGKGVFGILESLAVPQRDGFPIYVLAREKGREVVASGV
jgi:hypothetical protein